MKVRIVAALLVLAIYSCWNSARDRHVRRYLNDTEIVGTWVLTPETKDFLTRGGASPMDQATKLVLNADHSLTASIAVGPKWQSGEVPGWWFLEHDSHAHGHFQANLVKLEFRFPGYTYHRDLDCTEVGGPLQLWTYHGDPDNDVFVEYEKIK